MWDINFVSQSILVSINTVYQLIDFLLYLFSNIRDLQRKNM